MARAGTAVLRLALGREAESFFGAFVRFLLGHSCGLCRNSVGYGASVSCGGKLQILGFFSAEQQGSRRGFCRGRVAASPTGAVPLGLPPIWVPKLPQCAGHASPRFAQPLRHLLAQRPNA